MKTVATFRNRLCLAIVVLATSQAAAVAQDAVTSLLGQASQQFNAGRHAEAFATYDRAIDLATKTRGANSRQLADVLAMKGLAHAMLGDKEAARTLTERSVAIVEQSAGPDSRDAINARMLLGGMHVNFGETDAARAIFTKAVADARRRFGETDATTLQVTEAAAQAALRMGDVAEAVRLRRAVLAGWEKSRGRDAMETLAARSNLAHFLHASGDFAGAEQAFEETLRSLERRGMKDSVEVAAVRSNLGVMLVERGDNAKGLATLEAALASYVKSLGKDAPAVPTIRSNIARAKSELGRNEEALADYRELVATLERTAGPDDPQTLTVVNNLANVLTQMQRTAEAVPLLERVAATIRRTTPANDPRVMSADANLAIAYKLVGRGDDALRLTEAALATREKLLPEGHTDIGDALGNLADVLMFTGDTARAVEVTDREQRQNRIRDARILPALTDAEQATFLAGNTRPELEQALNVALQSEGVPAAAARSAAWLANAKGRGVEAAVTRMQVAKAAADPAAASRLAELAGVRRQMAALVQSPPQAGDGEKIRAQLATLGDRERLIVRDLGIAAAGDTAGGWVGIDRIRSALPAGSVLVDIARFARLDFKVLASGKRVHEEHYVAWVVPAAGDAEVVVVDLGNAIPINEAVADYRKAIQSAGGSTPAAAGATAEERLNADAARPLAALVLDPILESIAGISGGKAGRASESTITEIVLSPDGPLWLVPWSGLPTADGGYLVERYAVRLVTAGRDVVPSEPAEPVRSGTPSARPLVFAAPDFDLSPKGLAAALDRSAAGKASPSTTPATAMLASRASLPSLPKVAALPGTKAEVATISGPLEAVTGKAPEIFLGDAAQETVLKARAIRPPALVLATHGYFAAEKDASAPSATSSDTASARGGKDGGSSVDPLLRCGLLLAGANTAAEPRAATLDDGVLTGLEVAGLDLTGTRLVVLSACDTGIGDVRVGEGIAGLRRAFQAAGAESVVATLWQVPDLESARIMTAFYEHLAKGLPSSQALREAQLAFIKARRADRAAGESAHPYLWAAYGVTGK